MRKPTIGIIGGNGKMGHWFRNFFEGEKLTVRISGRKTKLTSKELAKKSDIVIITVPIAHTETVIKEVLAYIGQDTLLCDLTSLKVFPLKAMEQASCGTLGMHPLFGPTTTATNGQKIVFCKQKSNEYVIFLEKLFKNAGITVVHMSAEEHDYHMAYIQALTHALNLLYAKIIFDQKDALTTKLYTPVFRLQSLVMGRVLQQDLQLTRDIQMYNPYFLPLLENFAGYSKELLTILQEGKMKQFEELFKDDQRLGADFANFSVLHTDKILKLVSDVHVGLPQEREKDIVLPKRARIAYLGPQGTYAHQAVTMFHGNAYKKIPIDTIFNVFNAVLEGDVDIGVVPAENSTEGSVKGTLDYLADFSVYVIGSFSIPIHHQLASVEKNLDDISVVVSHPQAIAQCEHWIRKNIPHATIKQSASTTSNLSERRKRHGYICSPVAAKMHGLHIIAENIEDNPNNATRFYVLAKKLQPVKGLRAKRTLLFLTIYNRVGILRDILKVLADGGINLTRLESRPSYEKVWDYHFFIEVEAPLGDKRLKTAIKDLEKYCPVIRILGQT